MLALKYKLENVNTEYVHIFLFQGVIHENPVAAVMSTWLFVQVFLLMGTLNTIAQLSSVLFLLSYATVNLACLGLHLASAPNFRPTFKFFSWHTCLIGLVGTTTMMFFISPMFSAVSILLCLSLILALNFFSPVRNANWGSISQALLFHQVTYSNSSHSAQNCSSKNPSLHYEHIWFQKRPFLKQ